MKYASVAAERAFFKVLATWIRIDWLQGLHCILMTMFPIRLGSDAEFRTLREAPAGDYRRGSIVPMVDASRCGMVEKA